jgi:hypothetical protein
MKKVICFVLSTKNYSDRIKNIRRTWAKDIDTVFYSDHDDPINNVIKVSNKSDYYSAPIKQVNILNYIKELSDGDDNLLLDEYDWFFFVDDDTFVNKKKLEEYIQKLDVNKVYGSIITSENDSINPVYVNKVIDLDVQYPQGGAGFLVSSNVIRKIDKFKEYKVYHSDVAAGMNFHHNKVECVDVPILNRETPETYGHTEEEIVGMISYHNIKTFDQMKTLYEVCNEV